MRGWLTVAIVLLAAPARASVPPPGIHMVLQLDAARVERDALVRVLGQTR